MTEELQDAIVARRQYFLYLTHLFLSMVMVSLVVFSAAAGYSLYQAQADDRPLRTMAKRSVEQNSERLAAKRAQKLQKAKTAGAELLAPWAGIFNFLVTDATEANKPKLALILLTIFSGPSIVWGRVLLEQANLGTLPPLRGRFAPILTLGWIPVIGLIRSYVGSILAPYVVYRGIRNFASHQNYVAYLKAQQQAG